MKLSNAFEMGRRFGVQQVVDDILQHDREDNVGDAWVSLEVANTMPEDCFIRVWMDWWNAKLVEWGVAE